MTGYARQTRDTAWGTLQLELRTVNHRYLDLTLRVPDELRAVENTVRQILKDKLGRGKLEAYLRLRPTGEQSGSIALSESELMRLGAACSQIKQHISDAAPVDPLTVLRWPGVMQEREIDLADLREQVGQLTQDTVAELCAERAAEGARLAEVLLDRLGQIDDLVAQVEERLPEQNRLWREKLTQRLEELTDMEPERREQALVQFIQRLDVDEEIERLKSHCTAAREVMQRQEPIGRKLDFFMQEFNREANTLGSKSMDAQLTKMAVELKVVIEQMREQVQNIE